MSSTKKRFFVVSQIELTINIFFSTWHVGKLWSHQFRSEIFNYGIRCPCLTLPGWCIRIYLVLNVNWCSWFFTNYKYSSKKSMKSCFEQGCINGCIQNFSKNQKFHKCIMHWINMHTLCIITKFIKLYNREKMLCAWNQNATVQQW